MNLSDSRNSFLRNSRWRMHTRQNIGTHGKILIEPGIRDPQANATTQGLRKDALGAVQLPGAAAGG